MLRIFSYPQRTNPDLFESLITRCTTVLGVIQQRLPPPKPPSTSPALAAFDPAICRKLINHVPLPVVELIDINTAFKSLQRMLSDLSLTCSLDKSTDLLVWKVREKARTQCGCTLNESGLIGIADNYLARSRLLWAKRICEVSNHGI